MNVDWPDYRIDNFNLVIHLSNAKQLALPVYQPSCDVPLVLPSQCILRNAFLPLWSQSELPETLFFRCSSSFWSDTWPWKTLQAGTCFPGVAFFFWWFSGEVEHFVHLIWWNLNSCLCHCGTTWQRSRRGVTHDFCCRWNWVLFKLIVLVFHARQQLVPHLVPNSPFVPLRNVSWGLGVCSVFVRSVSPRRLVLEVRSFPFPPCAVSACCPSSVSAFFFLLPFRVDPAPAGCVCV